MRILITTRRWNDLTGAEMYVRDLALELQRQGDFPAVYTSSTGRIAEELRDAGIPVADSMQQLDFEPDVIHGHHHYETLLAIRRFRNIPAVFVCHHHNYWVDEPPRHSHVMRYCGVSKLCVERLLQSGIPAERVEQVYNFVDMKRFTPRPPLPQRPRRALVFSNYATEEGFLPSIEEACRRAEVELTVVGSGVGRPVERPEEIIGGYDIVFAKAKAAMEAISVGAAVVLCDFGGVGPIVTTANLSSLRKLNFGFEALTCEHSPEVLLRRIEQYDPDEARRVSALFRESAGLDGAAEAMRRIYGEVIAEYNRSRPIGGYADVMCEASLPAYRLAYRASAVWKSIPRKRRDAMVSPATLRSFVTRTHGILRRYRK